MRVLGRRIRPKAFLRDLRIALRTLVGGTESDRGLYVSLARQPETLTSLEWFATEMPQARLVDDCPVACEAEDWRRHFSRRLRGKGLEIGPLHRPMPIHDSIEIDYVDRYTIDQLRGAYPEMAKAEFVAPTLIDDAETLGTVRDGTYDFVVAAHVLEHMRNPIKALENWCRVLKPAGLIYLALPDKRAMFDRRRVRTTLEHLILDYRLPSEARDHDHFVEYAVHVHDKAGSEALAEAEMLLARDYSIHFHVFLPGDVVRLLDWFSANVRPVRVREGPATAPRDEEFHLLVEVP